MLKNGQTYFKILQCECRKYLKFNFLSKFLRAVLQKI